MQTDGQTAMKKVIVAFAILRRHLKTEQEQIFLSEVRRVFRTLSVVKNKVWYIYINTSSYTKHIGKYLIIITIIIIIIIMTRLYMREALLLCFFRSFLLMQPVAMSACTTGSCNLRPSCETWPNQCSTNEIALRIDAVLCTQCQGGNFVR
jgi:hypothetical protein